MFPAHKLCSVIRGSRACTVSILEVCGTETPVLSKNCTQCDSDWLNTGRLVGGACRVLGVGKQYAFLSCPVHPKKHLPPKLPMDPDASKLDKSRQTGTAWMGSWERHANGVITLTKEPRRCGLVSPLPPIWGAGKGLSQANHTTKSHQRHMQSNTTAVGSLLMSQVFRFMCMLCFCRGAGSAGDTKNASPAGASSSL